MRTGLLFVLLACTAIAAYAEQFTGKVIAVLDGDTVMVTRKGGPPVKVRLAGIDAPEVGHAGMGGKPPNSQKDQQGGMASKASLSGLALHKQVSVNSQATDSYGRLVAHLSVDGLDVNAEQIRLGMAWEYSGFHTNETYIGLQKEAQQARRGLWAGDEIVEPAQWRKLHPFTLPAAVTDTAGTRLDKTPPDPACAKKYCSQMTSCDEARHYLAQCGAKSLDSDGDGTPCERLCVPVAKN